MPSQMMESVRAAAGGCLARLFTASRAAGIASRLACHALRVRSFCDGAPG